MPEPFAPQARPDGGEPTELPGFVRAGSIWRSDLRLAPLGPVEPPLPWPAALRWSGGGADDTVVALDIETTGLAGAASMVFLVGVAWRDGNEVCVRQWLAPDLPFEPDLLDALATELPASGVRLVTFNGDAFDLPFLRTRARFCGVPLRLAPGLDVLPHARRLYRDRDGSCRLTHLEATRLGRQRLDDLPGALVPQVYYDALQREERALLEPIARHNAWDLVATLGLLWQVAHDLEAPLAPGADPHDLFGRFRHARSRADDEAAAAALEACLAADPPAWVRRRAVAELARLHRRRGAVGERHALWERMASDPDAPPVFLVEWAKVLEHEVRDLPGAHAAAGAALARLRGLARLTGHADAQAEAAILHRLERLERRMRGRARPSRAG